MLASLNWIKEFVDVSASPQEIADKLSMAGLEIEAVKALGAGMAEIFSAKILKREKHPNADRLSLCEVQCGPDLVSVVCGADNMKAGDKVALARPGAKLPNGLEIKISKIRKVESHGMLCSESELGLATESEGILILPPETPDGLPLKEVLALNDTVFEVNVTPNRGDCLSMQGLAREVAANFGLTFNPILSKNSQGSGKANGKIAVEITAPELCPRYSCRVLKGIQVGPSPQWMIRRLESCGIRAINNVVDATNYVMLETGQPLHAFDLRQIHSNTIRVRRAKSGEVMKTLDGFERKLSADDLVIADPDRILAVAGVMGGEDSGIVEDTTDLLLESAFFDPNSVRRTARNLALQTESSYRFERGIDPNGCVSVLDRLTQVIVDIAGGEGGPVSDAYPKKIEPIELTLRSSRIQKLLGVSLSPSEIVPPLQALGIQGKEGEGGTYHLKIPTSRSDLTREVDLIEEVARLFGYNNIPVTYPEISLQDLMPTRFNWFEQVEQLRKLWVGWGFTEVLHYSFTSPHLLDKFGIEYSPTQTLLNPLSEDLSVMRPALFPQMVQTLQNNIFKGNKDLQLFEIRPVYHPSPGGARPLAESWHLCLGMSGSRRPLHFLEKDEVSSQKEFQGLTLLDLKGYLQTLAGVGLPEYRLIEKPLNKAYFHPKRQLLLELQGPGEDDSTQPLGWLGRLHPQLLEEMDLPVPILVAEINLDLFLTESKICIQFQEISPFPTVWRDLNLIVEEETPNGEVIRVIRSQGGPWLKRAELFDVYRGKPLAEGKKALTYRIEYGAHDRTLTDDEVNKAREKLLEGLKKQIGATLR